MKMPLLSFDQCDVPGRLSASAQANPVVDHTSPQSIPTTTPCRLCQRPVTVPTNEQALEVFRTFPEWRRKLWLLALCHDQCSDRWDKRRRTEDSIARMAYVLENFDDPDRRARIRGRLENVTKEWAFNESMAYGGSRPHWSWCIVDAIMKQPEMWQVTIREARERIRDLCDEDKKRE